MTARGMKRDIVRTVGAALLATYQLQPWAYCTPFPSATGGAATRASRGCGVRPPIAPGETGKLSIPVGDLEREYRLHLPPGYAPGRAVSLILDFHGYTGTAEQEEHDTGLSRHADEHGYAVVYPQATAFVAGMGDSITSWNDLSCNASPGPEGPICSETAFKYAHPPDCGEPRPCNWCTCHDDLEFVDRLLDRLGETLCIDLDRVYATGMSNGGMFVHRLGCDMPDRFAAIAPVGGTLARGFNCAPDTSTPLSVMNIYGSRDRVVSQDGTMSSDGYYYTAAEDVMSKWASPGSQDCEAVRTPYETSESGTLGLICTQHEGCSTGAEVVNCTWDGGHDWPKDEADDLANEIIREFFAKHTRSKYRTAEEND